MRYLLLLALPFVMACPLPESCVPETTRCDEQNMAEICGSDGMWRTLMDCNNVGSPGWRCCPMVDGDGGAGHSCLPPETC
jgi:hypothetical protein